MKKQYTNNILRYLPLILAEIRKKSCIAVA